jgi:hypothetical protein
MENGFRHRTPFSVLFPFHFHQHFNSLPWHFYGTSTHFHDTSIGRISMTFPMEKRGEFPRHFQWKSHGKSLSMEATLMVMALPTSTKRWKFPMGKCQTYLISQAKP